MEPRFQAPERQKGLGRKEDSSCRKWLRFKEWFFHPASFSEEHLQGYKAMVNMAGEVESMEALLAAAGDTDAAHGVMAILKPAFECMRLICQSMHALMATASTSFGTIPTFSMKRGTIPRFLKQLQATEKEHFALGYGSHAWSIFHANAEVIAEIGIVDGRSSSFFGHGYHRDALGTAMLRFG